MREPCQPSRIESSGTLVGAIGKSELGVPLRVYYAGPSAAPLRALVLAGQHGDEGRARAAVERFLEKYMANRLAAPVSLAVVPNLNPDGASAKSRLNASGLDLNRDHLLLESAETRALHGFVRDWKPHLVIDVHTYPSRRARLLAQGLAHCHDVFLDVPTNPVAECAVAGDILHSSLARLNARGYCAGRYVLETASGRVRHSTADVLDLRNALAIRYGIPTILIEGRQPLRSDGAGERARLKAALVTAVESTVECAGESPALLAPTTAIEHDGVAIRCRYVTGGAPCIIPMRDLHSGAIRPSEISGEFSPLIRVSRRAILPRAYAVPKTHLALLEVLRRHDLPGDSGHPDRIETVEFYRIRRAEVDRPRRRPLIDRMRDRRVLTDYLLFPVTPESGRALAVYLEPESKFGLHRFSAMNLTMRTGDNYPILTVTEQ